MGAVNFRSGYEFDPAAYDSQYAGGLLGRLQAVMSPGETATGFGSGRMDESQFDPEAYVDQQGGLLGRLRSLQAQQQQYQPVSGPKDTAFPSSQDPDFRELARLPNAAAPLTPNALTPAAPPSFIQVSDADRARQAREAAAARMARGVRSPARMEGPPPDPIDIAKSAGIGLVNGTVNMLGLPGEIATGFGYLPNNFLRNELRRTRGLEEFPAEEPDWIRQHITADAIRQGIEGLLPWRFYQPKTRTGRYVETIGEFVPAILGTAGLAALRGGAGALSELPATIAKHAVAPGVVVQGIEDAYPESQLGPTLQKAYPLARRVVPAALAATRYLRRMAP